MRHRIATGFAAIALLIALAGTVAPTSPAAAASWASQPGPQVPSSDSRYKATTTANGGATTDSLWCYGEDAPSPQFSASTNDVHWGMKTFCNHVDTLWIRTKLWTVVGTGDHEHYDYQTYAENSGVATELIAGGVRKCVVRTTGRWIVSTEATATLMGGELPPYPAWGPVFTLGCSDVV